MMRAIADDRLLVKDSPGYDRARTVWNAMVDRRPRAIVRCASPDDVADAIRYGRERELEIGVRCGGHSVLGLCVPDGGLMIDLRPMGGVRVDPERRRARVQGGALLGALDRATTGHGLATTAGNVSHTGVGGRTLGGGMGWLARRHGLSCDNVASYELLTADGERLHVDEAGSPELYWGLRGGGGNFGIVTEFEFRLHRVARQAHVVELFFGIEDAAPVMRGWRDLNTGAPRAATFTAWVGDAPPLLGPEWRGRPVASVGFVWAGEPDLDPELLAAVRAARPPSRRAGPGALLPGAAADRRRPARARRAPLLEGPLLPVAAGRGDRRIPAARHARRTRRDAAGGIASGLRRRDRRRLRRRQRVRSPRRDVRIRRRRALVGPAEDEQRISAARRYATSLEPFATGLYVNAMSDEGAAGVARAYSPAKLALLQALKVAYDPGNVFHLNQNITPA